MLIIPAIDIKAGKCVRLYQGKFEQSTEYPGHPWEIAKAYAKAGAKFIHVVDLDGAKEGAAVQLSRIGQICQLQDLQVQVGGGIRSHRHIKILLADGAARVVIGSMAVSYPALVKSWLDEFDAEKVVLAFDVHCEAKKDPAVMTEGWQSQASQNVWQLIEDYAQSGLKRVLCTDIHLDGTLKGPNITLYQQCVSRFPNIAFQASGGVGSLEDLLALKQVGVEAAIVGKALLEKRFSVEQALAKLAGSL